MFPKTERIQIGSQTLHDIGDRLRFTIKEVLPEKGTAGQFGLRDKIVAEAIKRAKPLEVMFEERPDLHIMYNPLKWKALARVKEQKGYYSTPMRFYFYSLNNRGEVV